MCISAPSAPAPAPVAAPAPTIDPQIAIDAKKKKDKLRFNRGRSGSMISRDSLLTPGTLGPAS